MIPVAQINVAYVLILKPGEFAVPCTEVCDRRLDGHFVVDAKWFGVVRNVPPQEMVYHYTPPTPRTTGINWVGTLDADVDKRHSVPALRYVRRATSIIGDKEGLVKGICYGHIVMDEVFTRTAE